MIKWIGRWFFPGVMLVGVSGMVMSILGVICDDSTHQGLWMKITWGSLGLGVLGWIGESRKRVFEWFFESHIPFLVCFIGMFATVAMMVGIYCERDWRQHIGLLRISWLLFQVFALGIYAQVINQAENNEEDTWDNFRKAAGRWVSRERVWLTHSLILSVLGMVLGMMGVWAGIWKLLMIYGMMWGVVGIWKALRNSPNAREIVEYLFDKEGENKVPDLGLHLDHPFGTSTACASTSDMSMVYKVVPTECDKLQEDKEGMGDDMKAIWKTLTGKQGGILWLKVGEDEKMPTKYMLDPLVKECKKREMMILVTKGSELKVMSDLSMLSDEVLKGMGLMRYDSNLDVAMDELVEKMIAKKDEEDD